MLLHRPEQQSVPTVNSTQLSIHGVNDLLATKNKGYRVLWALILLTATACCIYSLTSTLADYMAEPYAVKIAYHQPDNYPPIAYCPMSTVRDKDLTRYKLTLDHYTLMKSMYFASFPARAIRYGHPDFGGFATRRAQLSLEISEVLVNANLTLGELLLELSLTPEELLPIDFPTSHVGIRKQLTWYGACYTATFNTTLDAFAGAYSPAYLVFKLHKEESYPMLMEEIPFDWLFVGPGSDLPYPAPALAVPRTGVQFTILMDAVKVNRRKECSPRVNPRSQFECITACLNQDPKRIEADVRYYQPEEITFENSVMRKGVEDVEHSPGFTKRCSKKCLPPCSQWLYSTTFLTVPLTVTNKTVVSLHFVNYAETRELTEEPILSGFGFLSQVGGLVSLWFGASLLTFPQLGFLAFNALTRKRRPKRSASVTTYV